MRSPSFAVLILAACASSLSLAGAQETTNPPSQNAQTKKEEITKTVRKELESAISNYFVIETGQVKDGEQIPAPVYRDGTQAQRGECRYMVSPAEIPTSLTYVSNLVSGAFYIKCYVDREGVAHVSLWQQSGSGEGVKVIGADSYDQVKKQFTVPGVTSPSGEENVVIQQMKVLSERLIVNYMVAAIRSSPSGDSRQKK